MEVPTVKILSSDTESGFMIINQDQYDPNTMQLWEEPKSDELKSEEMKPEAHQAASPLTPKASPEEKPGDSTQESAERRRRGP